MQKIYPLNWKIIGTAGAVLLVVLALLSVAGGGPVNAQTPVTSGEGPVNSISVSGSGDASGTPDVAFINLGVDTTDKDVGKAVEDANKKMAAIIAAISDT